VLSLVLGDELSRSCAPLSVRRLDFLRLLAHEDNASG
jgi:hypothetical protein